MRLTIRDSRGATNTTSQIVTLRDKLIVAVGDSFASGEGNPESQNDVPDWIDEQCHRSDAAWPARVARSLETRSTVVTFLSFACSGAEIRHLTHVDYEGAEPAEPLPPQLVVARRLLGDPLNTAMRQADVVLLAAGVNDLHIGSILSDCATTVIGSCEVSLAREHQALPESYDELEAAISANLRAASTVIAQYPARLFTNGADEHDACEAFSNMSDHDASWITDEGNDLNRTLNEAATRHGWTSVAVTDTFRRHGYCADDHWFRKWKESLAKQEDNRGTAHPNCAATKPWPSWSRRASRSTRSRRRCIASRSASCARGDRRRHRRSQRARAARSARRLQRALATQRLRPPDRDTTRFGIAGQSRDLADDPCLRFPL